MPGGEEITHEIETEFLGRAVRLEVLLPDDFNPEEAYPVLYVLPVNAGLNGPWGHGMTEARNTDIANKHGIICVAPEFDRMPWYADHPDDTHMRHESHLLKVVLPYMDEHYPTRAEPRGRWLVGFSKSGWGACSLLLRNLGVFGRAASWDAPLLKAAPDEWDMPEMFGSQENFEEYRITTLLLRHAEELSRGPRRLVLLGQDFYREETEYLHRALAEVSIPHVYCNEVARKHRWDSGWFAEAVGLLAELE